MKISRLQILLVLIISLLFYSCAKLPVESIDVTQYLLDEGARMHKMNAHLLNGVFKEKREKIDQFISEEYVPAELNRIFKKIDSTDDPKEAIPEIMKLLTPKIIDFRDQLQNALETNRIKIMTKLNDDYSNFQQAGNSLKAMLKSVVKVDQERQKLLEDIKKYTNNNLDLNSIESVLDKYIIKGGDMGSKVIEMNNEIDKLLNK